MTNDTHKALPKPHASLTDAQYLHYIAETLITHFPEVSRYTDRIKRIAYSICRAATTREAVAWTVCEDCNGAGEVGEAYGGSEFQPPERDRCESCNGSGRWPAPTAPADALVASNQLPHLADPPDDYNMSSVAIDHMRLYATVYGRTCHARGAQDVINVIRNPGFGIEGVASVTDQYRKYLLAEIEKRLATPPSASAIVEGAADYDDLAIKYRQLQVRLSLARRDALEEAAKALDREKYQHRSWADNETIRMCASVVRALASPPAAQSDHIKDTK